MAIKHLLNVRLATNRWSLERYDRGEVHTFDSFQTRNNVDQRATRHVPTCWSVSPRQEGTDHQGRKVGDVKAHAVARVPRKVNGDHSPSPMGNTSSSDSGSVDVRGISES